MIKPVNTVGEFSLRWAKQNNLTYDYSKFTKSTQDLAKAEAFKLNTNLKLYITEYQEQGRGRIDKRTWISKAEDNFLSTWSYKFLPTNILPSLSEQIAQQVIISAKKTWPNLPWKLQLPNDIYINDKKIAGLLIDILNQGKQNRLLIGLGFNIYSSPENLATTSTCLFKETSLPMEKWQIFLDSLFCNWKKLLAKNA
ncbi:MAG: hypothetical protein HAW63_02080 [Bdellovibrionaceae bacterium]|nr:hypothetical protein [Pseudobdellovibrionaceae bacterium]